VFVTCSTRLAVCLTPSLSSGKSIASVRLPTDGRRTRTHPRHTKTKKYSTTKKQAAFRRAARRLSRVSALARSPLAARGGRCAPFGSPPRAVPDASTRASTESQPDRGRGPRARGGRAIHADLYRRGRRRDDATGRGPAPGVRLQAVATRPSDRVLNRRGGVAGDAMEMVWRELWVIFV